ncbi:MAG TPA: polysaccharide biosynthesis C-terminal domain-containing protein [Candidatus Omnitrophota bacterium]|jgi:O-antigen/teichoic acid export membrane protein|nr:polysaccharide biosynthesis C-terminal domain-containing protein [Candidatus Omnitrophota bacterium]HSA30241.1 polysaccharide biosynthesis C-terminal domain-containing protein [Candidatus Omnitrophota bacterium]
MLIIKEFRRFLVYGFGNVVQSAINFLFLPLFLNQFSPADYGVINVLLVGVTLVSTFISCGLINSIQSQYFNEAEGRDRGALSGNVFFWYCISSVVCAAPVLFYAGEISATFFSSDVYVREVQMVGLLIPLLLIVDIPFNILRMEKRANAYVLLSIVRLAVDFALKYLFIVVLRRGIVGYFESSVIAMIVVNAVLYMMTLRYMSFELKISQMAMLLKLGAPFIITSFTVWSLQSTDKLMINFMLGRFYVGIYSTAEMFSKIFNMFVFRPVNLLLPPVIFAYIAQKTREQTDEMFKNLLSLLVVAGCAFLIIISLASEDILRILIRYFGSQPEYIESVHSIFYLTLSNFFYYLTLPVLYVILMLKKTGIMAICSVYAAFINVVLNYFLIFKFGVRGAAFATALSNVFLTALLYWVVQRRHRINYDFKAVCVLIMGASVIFTVCRWLTFRNEFVSLVARSFLGLVCYSVFAWYIKGAVPEQYKNLLRERFKIQKRPCA